MSTAYAIGLSSDGTYTHFVEEAARHGADVVAIDLREVVASADWRLAIPDDGASWLRAAGRRHDLDPGGGYFCRIIDLSKIEPNPQLAARWRWLVTALLAWLDHVPGCVVNRPSMWADNGSKPLHEARLGRTGFRVPESLTSSDPDRLRAFAAQGPTIVKALSGVRATTRLVRPDEFEEFTATRGPVHLQRYIVGNDVRVHICGIRIHAQEIEAPTVVDYRTADAANISMTNCDLPIALADQLVASTRDAGMLLAGWDLKVDPDGTYWALEANPMPGYDWYDHKLDGAVTVSLLDLLNGVTP
jgi:glutathione synthase/RimK-type ligase-like ATP-grasp enzyme